MTFPLLKQRLNRNYCAKGADLGQNLCTAGRAVNGAHEG